MKIAIGSKNPAKIKAVEDAFRSFFPSETLDFIAVEVASGVSDQPMNDKETVTGARNRAMASLNATKADYGVGLEGGLQQLDDFWLTGNIAAVVKKEGRAGVGMSARIAIPASVYEHVKSGKELSHAIEEVYGLKDVGKKEGLLGMMSGNRITRTGASKDAVIAALSSLGKAD